MWNVLRTELRRGPAPLAALITVVAGLLIVSGEPVGARWMSLAAAVQYSLFLVAPLVTAVAVWHGGREHRRRVGPLIESTSRPRYGQVLVNWAALTLGVLIGLLVVVGIAAIGVAPRATYWGGGWWWILAASFLGLAAAAAVGMLVGRAFPYRALAPLAAVGGYAAIIGVLDGPSGGVAESDLAMRVIERATDLVPVARTNDYDGQVVSTPGGLPMLLWLVAVIIAAVVIMAARRSFIRVGVVALPMVAAWYVGYQPTGVDVDEAAQELVCTEDGAVCVTRVNSYDLPAATAVAHEQFAHWAGVDGAPQTAVEDRMYGQPVPSQPAVRLFEVGGEWSAMADLWPMCEISSSAAERAAGVAQAWAALDGETFGDTEAISMAAELTSWNDRDQRDWMSRYVEAAGSCDQDELGALADELT